MVRGSMEKALNERLKAEATRYERSKTRQSYLGYYNRDITTTSRNVTLHMP